MKGYSETVDEPGLGTEEGDTVQLRYKHIISNATITEDTGNDPPL
jgi:hypothetical protein